MKAATLPLNSRRSAIHWPTFVVPGRELDVTVESSLYYAIAMAFVLPYVIVKRMLPVSWTAGFIGSEKTIRQSVFREAHVEIQTVLGSVFRA